LRAFFAIAEEEIAAAGGAEIGDDDVGGAEAGAEELAEALWQCAAAGTWTTADARRWWESQSDTQSGENAPPSTIASGYGKGCVLLEIARGPDGAFAPKPVYEHNRMRSKFATGVLHRDHLYGFDETLLVCMEFRTGKVKWKQRGFGQGSLIVSGDCLIVLGEEGRLALVDACPDAYRERGSWTLSKTRCWAPPSVANGRLFLRDQESVFCFDLESPQ